MRKLSFWANKMLSWHAANIYDLRFQWDFQRSNVINSMKLVRPEVFDDLFKKTRITVKRFT